NTVITSACQKSCSLFLGLLRSVSRAVDLIMAHFGSRNALYFPLAQIRMGNSSWSPTISGLVLEHLCPAIQNILEDGLRDHKLDLIVGQRRNHSWTVVEARPPRSSIAW
uniref:RUN domain-containing protein n=1 Tax=Echeneis naucrates TaxID=173247 RepID=A0A665V379_ECHNA